MTSLQIRRVPFDFNGDIPFQWHPGNPDFAIMCNAIGVLAIAFEKYIVASVGQAIPRITDPGVAAEADAFLRQEAQHARAHRLHMKALVRRHPGLKGTVDEAVAAFDRLLDTKPLEYHLAYTADLEATFTPLFKVMLDHNDRLFRPGEDRVASLFLWHFVEEVEHRSSSMIIYRSVVGNDRYRLRMLPSIVRHVVGVYSRAIRSFQDVVAPNDRTIDVRRLLPGRMWLREIGVRLPGVRRRVTADGYPTAFSAAGAKELLGTAYRLVQSQTPSHDPTHTPTPGFADEWFAGYDEGVDVTRWYASTTANEGRP